MTNKWAVPLLWVAMGNLQSCQLPACAAPPRPPAVFDKIAVQNLIDHVDEDHNAALLKFYYFLHRIPQTLPLQDGYSLLKESVAKEKPGSRRWCMLQQVSGFAALQMGQEMRSAQTLTEAYDTYDTIFVRYCSDQGPGTDAVVERAALELAATMPNAYGFRVQGITEKSKQAILDALKSHFIILRHDPAIAVQPPWTDAVEVVAGGSEFAAVTDASLKQWRGNLPFTVLQTAAMVYIAAEPKQAVSLLETASVSTSYQTNLEFGWIHQALITALTSNNQFDDAIRAQQDFADKHHRGWAELADIHFQKGFTSRKIAPGDEKEIERIESILCQSQSSEQDVIEMAQYLCNWMGVESQDSSLRDRSRQQLVMLLGSYLNSARSRTMSGELHARILLARELMRENKLSEAKIELAIDQYKPPFTSEQQRIYGLALELFNQISRLQKSD